jgi:hypothetical protein
MKKHFLKFLIPVLAAMCMLAACSSSSDDDGPGLNPPALPAAVGTNELSGEAYFSNHQKGRKIEFAADGTYKFSGAELNSGVPVLILGKITWVELENGKYSWNATAKSVTLAPEHTLDAKDSDHGWDLPLEDMAGLLAQFRQGNADEGWGYSDAELIAAVNENFAARKYDYSFSTASPVVLFLDEPLPANVGANELNGETYDSTNYVGATVEFTSDTDYKVVYSATEIENGKYSYDRTDINDEDYAGDATRVYLKPTQVFSSGLKTREDYYTAISGGVSPGYFLSAAEYNAAQTNGNFEVSSNRYWDNGGTGEINY